MTVDAHDDDQIAQYVAGTLPAGELEAFEQHLLTCERCRAAVRVGAAARTVLLTPAITNGGRWRRQLPWLGVAAAVLIAVVATRRDAPGGALGDVEPAAFVGGALRPSMDSTTALIDSGMRDYQASDFTAAAEKLRRAVQADSSPAVRFFLGVSLLMRGDAETAFHALREVSIESPYAHEAVYYAAKALVRLGRPDSALAMLEQKSSGSPLPVSLRAFADSLRRR